MLDNYKIGNRIAQLRREKGLTGEKFAELLGVSPQAVSKWENGKNLPETALLPNIAALLGTSVDSILITQKLAILDARYTCGSAYIVVTDVIDRAVSGNSLKFTAKCPIGGNSPEGAAVFVLTVKYQTPDGVYYAFAPQNETLELSLESEGFTAKSGFEIVGAYYGIGDEYKSVMDKMQHYEYFKRDEIHVNHETFPSSPGVDESEYLTLVYINRAGIHVISCEENGVLQYSEDRTSLFAKNTAECILPGIDVLEWGANNKMPCTWGGALYTALKYMGETHTYEQIMGMSGACYRIAFAEVWDWSALDALVAYSYDVPLYNAIGYEPIWACRLEKDERTAERRQIVSDILHGKPVVAINLRVAAEWGVITGYGDGGKTLYCRTYFDGEVLNENKDYLKTENWPFLITHFGEKRDIPSKSAILTASLRALVNSFEATPRDEYFQGKQGYEKWIEGLRNDAIWSEQCPENDLRRRFDVHLSTVYQLSDARRCAAVYLTECCAFAGKKISPLLKEMTDSYINFTCKLDLFKEGLLKNGVVSFLGTDGGKVKREEQSALLESALAAELRNVEIAKEAMRLLEEKESAAVKKNGLADDKIIKMTVEDVGCIYEYTVTRSASAKSNGDKIVKITVKSPREEEHLIERTYGHLDAEMYRYDALRAHIKCIPQIYEVDLTNKIVLKEDLNFGYVSGFNFNEDNEDGLYFRRNHSAVLKAAADWHGTFWENYDAFGAIGLDWRLETKENLTAHIGMMEKDFRKYKKNEASGQIPKVWEGDFNGVPFRFENNITPAQLDYLADAVSRLKNEYWQLVEARFHAGKSVTIIHGDMHPGTTNLSRTDAKIVKFDKLQAVRMGLPTEDLAMLLALHIDPKSQSLVDEYYRYLCEIVKDYPYETFINDYKISVMENMFFTIRLINRGIFDFKMRDRAIAAYETFVLGK